MDVLAKQPPLSLKKLFPGREYVLFALCDRNDAADDWRHVYLERRAGAARVFILRDEGGRLLDEPDHGCGNGHVAEADLKAEWGDFYCDPLELRTDEERNRDWLVARLLDDKLSAKEKFALPRSMGAHDVVMPTDVPRIAPRGVLRGRSLSRDARRKLRRS